MSARLIPKLIVNNDTIPLIDEEFDTFDTGSYFNGTPDDTAVTTWYNEYLWDDYSHKADLA